MTDRRELSLLRLASHRLIGPPASTARDAVHWLTAVQAQDLKGALLSVALRTRSRSRADVTAALVAGEVVRSWPMRGTLHLVAAEDLLWMLDVAAPRIINAMAGRHARLGLDARSLDCARELAEGALGGGRSLSRAELFAVWRDGGHDTAGQRGVHTLSHLCRVGVLCLGPLDGAEQRVVLVADAIPVPRRLERDEGLGEWARRYVAGHGPVTVKDFARWANLTLTEARAGLATVRSELDSMRVDGIDYLLDARTPELLSANRDEALGVLLLPGFDELMLGYADRSAALPAAFADAIVPGGNGMFRATVVSAGQVIGTWRTVGTGVKRRIEATPFTTFSAAELAGIAKAYADLP